MQTAQEEKFTKPKNVYKKFKIRNMIYLGINVSHNASAALMVDGEIVIAVQEERFTKKKNFQGYPKKSIDYCINYVKKKKRK